MVFFRCAFLLLFIFNKVSTQGCKAREYGDSVVCVCDESYCDKLEPIGDLKPGTAHLYESSKSGKRLESSEISFNNTLTIDNNIFTQDINAIINRSINYQTILGFGGAFTDSAGINIASLPTSLQDELIKAYYSSNGLEYDIGRIPIASCDFSTHEYSYDDTVDDFDLKDFNLVPEDVNYKIPYIKKAQEASSKEILLFASPWSSPFWMKTNNNMSGWGSLKSDPDRKYHKSYANYLIKFLQEYEKHNLTMWGLTVQNEPLDGFIPFFPFQCLAFSGSTERDFVVNELGPALEKAGYGPDKVKLMIFDDQRLFMKSFAKTVLENATANKYVSGIAFHWYANSISPPTVTDEVHDLYPDKFILATEACEGSNPFTSKVMLGDWGRAESYAKDIIEDLLHWTVGWVDWNLALDLTGGPNWAKNNVDAPIIVNSTAKEFYKQPMYYALAHYSKFLPRGSHRISLTADSKNRHVDLAAFQRPDGAIVILALNRKWFNVNLSIKDPDLGIIKNILPSRSMQTYIWKR